jgi:predicted amidohydrolase
MSPIWNSSIWRAQSPRVKPCSMNWQDWCPLNGGGILRVIAHTPVSTHHVKIAFGVDDEPEFLPEEFLALVRGGMKPIEAIQAATINAARLLGLSDQTGTIERGKVADLIGVSSDPLHNIDVMRRVIFVMHNGEVMKDESETGKHTPQ